MLVGAYFSNRTGKLSSSAENTGARGPTHPLITVLTGNVELLSSPCSFLIDGKPTERTTTNHLNCTLRKLNTYLNLSRNLNWTSSNCISEDHKEIALTMFDIYTYYCDDDQARIARIRSPVWMPDNNMCNSNKYQILCIVNGFLPTSILLLCSSFWYGALEHLLLYLPKINIFSFQICFRTKTKQQILWSRISREFWLEITLFQNK